MDIFKRNKDRSLSSLLTTDGFIIGKPESEAEHSYRVSEESPFDDFLDALPKIGEGHFIITGRKGAGKSAIAKYIKDNSSPENQIYCEIIKSDGIKLEREIQQYNDTDLGAFFEWLIFTKIVKLILETEEGNYTPEIKSLRNFVKNNSGLVDIDKFSLKEISLLDKKEIKLGALSNISSFGAILDRVLGKKMEKASFCQLVPALKQIIYKILSFNMFYNHRFIVLFDDLDVNFKADNVPDKSTILSLIRATKEINNYLKSINIKTTILIFLRDDIKKVLKGFASDSNKMFESYEVELKWYDHLDFKKDESQILLRKFINKRIKNNFRKFKIPHNEHDPWNSLLEDILINGKTPFKFFLDYSFYRPRDFILLFNNISDEKMPIPINEVNFIKLIKKYINKNIEELKDELSIYFSQNKVDDIFTVLRHLAYSQYNGFAKNIIIDKLQNKQFNDDCFELLIEYSLIIPFDIKTGKYYIKYRESDYSSFDIDDFNINYKLHNCIYAYFFPESINKH